MQRRKLLAVIAALAAAVLLPGCAVHVDPARPVYYSPPAPVYVPRYVPPPVYVPPPRYYYAPRPHWHYRRW